jgi:hypothetical protein
MAVRAVGVLLVIAGGCSTIAGLDNEYEQESAFPSGGGGGAGGSSPCLAREDCPADTECATWACSGGACVGTIAPDGTPVTNGAVQGDCKKNVCQGGAPALLSDDTDLVPDNDSCTVEMCTAGVKQTGPAPNGTACGSTGKLACQNGLCEGCSQDPSNCDAPTPCQAVECPVNTCVYPIQEGKVLDDASPTDCKMDVCDAQGNKVTVGDTTDTPPQMGDDCKAEVCGSDGNVAQMNANEGVKCDNAMSMCHNDSVCASGACAAQLKPAGTKVSDNGKGGDCKALVCDGMGGTMEGVDNTDVPVDPDPSDCVYPVCIDGVVIPSAPRAEGDVCTSAASGKCCGTTCCPNAVGAGFCDGNDVCCASNKTCGGTCCPSSSNSCAGNTCCAKVVCNDVCCPTTHGCEPDTNDCCPVGQRCGNGTCCPESSTCNANNQCILF